MAEPRKSAKQTDARRRAREKAAQFRELQDTLEQHAVDYFVAIDSVDAINDETEREIERLRERATAQTQKARDTADQIVGTMIAAGASATEVATRLGVSVRDVKKATKPTPASTPTEEGNTSPDAPETDTSDSSGDHTPE